MKYTCVLPKTCSLLFRTLLKINRPNYRALSFVLTNFTVVQFLVNFFWLLLTKPVVIKSCSSTSTSWSIKFHFFGANFHDKIS